MGKGVVTVSVVANVLGVVIILGLCFLALVVGSVWVAVACMATAVLVAKVADLV